MPRCAKRCRCARRYAPRASPRPRWRTPRLSQATVPSPFSIADCMRSDNPFEGFSVKYYRHYRAAVIMRQRQAALSDKPARTYHFFFYLPRPAFGNQLQNTISQANSRFDYRNPKIWTWALRPFCVCAQYGL